MKKKYDSPEFDFYEIQVLDNMMGDSQPESDASDGNDPADNPFGG